jgi:SAM-dependent methyltransferase
MNNICNICGNKEEFLNTKIFAKLELSVFRDKMYCPKCHSQERHRFIWEYLKANKHLINNKIVTHCSSEPCLENQIKKLTNFYFPIDLNPSPYRQTQMDIQEMKFFSDSIDTFICSHVLEHVPDDNKAIKEISRILKKDGTALLLIPINGREHTTEFSTPNKKDFDHMRDYGYIDFMDKLKLYFTSVKRILPQDILNKELIETYSLSYEMNQGIFECKK